MNLLVMYSLTLSCYLPPLRAKYLPQHPILEHPQPLFLPQCERPKLTKIKVFMTAQSSVQMCIEIAKRA